MIEKVAAGVRVTLPRRAMTAGTTGLISIN
jgi:hypothetical protein